MIPIFGSQVSWKYEMNSVSWLKNSINISTCFRACVSMLHKDKDCALLRYIISPSFRNINALAFQALTFLKRFLDQHLRRYHRDRNTGTSNTFLRKTRNQLRMISSRVYSWRVLQKIDKSTDNWKQQYKQLPYWIHVWGRFIYDKTARSPPHKFLIHLLL